VCSQAQRSQLAPRDPDVDQILNGHHKKSPDLITQSIQLSRHYFTVLPWYISWTNLCVSYFEIISCNQNNWIIPPPPHFNFWKFWSPDLIYIFMHIIKKLNFERSQCILKWNAGKISLEKWCFTCPNQSIRIRDNQGWSLA
jgi:hypothetical protein